MNLFQISCLITAIISFFGGFAVFFNNRKEKINIFWFLSSIAIGIWSIGLFGVVYSTNYLSALFWQYVLDIGGILIPVFYFVFILYFLNIGEKYKIFKKASFFIGFVLFVFSFTKLFKLGVSYMDSFNFWINPGLLYFIFPLYFIFYLFFTYFLLIKTYKQVSDHILKNQIRYVFIAQTIGFGGGITNFFPQLFNIYPFGNYLISIYIVFISYAVLKHGLFNIKVIATELLVFAIWVAVLFELLLEKSLKGMMLVGGLFIFTIIAGILLIKSVLKEVKQREEIQKLAENLKVVNEKLIETDKMKSAMYSFVSHQIKAPISIVKGFAQLILDGSYGKIPKKVKDTVSLMKDSSNRLIELTNNFLDLRKIEEGKMEYEFKEINFIDLIKSVFDELKLLASQKKLEFNLECAEEKIMVKADEQRLRQVILNLIENSIKYTEKGFVKVGLQLTTNDQRQKSVLFSVNDSGIGIKPEILPELFDQFKRAKEARNIQGTGLGLYVAREIVKAHGGEIWAESEGENKGSKFFVKLAVLQ